MQTFATHNDYNYLSICKELLYNNFMKLSSNQKIALYCAIMVLIIIILVLSQMILFSYQTSQDKIMPGIYINGFYVGGMTKQQAHDAITGELAEYLLDNNTTIVNGETELTVNASDISDIDVDALVDEAYAVYRDGNKITYIEFILMKFKPHNIETTAVLDWQNIYDYIELNKDVFYKGAIDAQLLDYSFEDNQLKLIIAPSEKGYEVNMRETATSAQSALLNHSQYVYAIMDEINPKITTDALMQMADNPIEYSQHIPVKYGEKYYTAPEDMQLIDDLTEPALIMPGQSISIKDFMMYDVYNPKIDSFKSLHVPTIIYGCALQVGLNVDEHHVPYYITDDMIFYPLGQEAILAADRDLVITNNFDYPVILALNFEDDDFTYRLTCKIYTVEHLEYTYPKSVIEEHDEMYEVKVYRVYANDTGGVLSRTLLEQHEYPVPEKPNNIEDTLEEESVEVVG